MKTTTIPTTMRALVQPDRTSTQVILTEHPVPKPSPTSEEHLIKVHAVAPCARELIWFRDFPVAKDVFIPCYDVAGEVVLAPQGSPFKPGDEVYARSHYARPGAASDYTILLTHEFALRPKTGLSWAESVTVPLSALTAWQALFDQAGWAEPAELLASEQSAAVGTPKPKRRLLVNAAAGGCGIWVVQLGHLLGAHVIGTCGPDNVDFVKSLGADEAINYRETDLAEWGKSLSDENKVDLVIDCVGGKSLEQAWWCVKPGGTLISIVNEPEKFKPKDYPAQADDIRHFFFVMSPNGAQLSKITTLIEQGKCRPVLDSVFALKDFERAFQKVETGHARGKVVISFDEV